MSGSICPKIAPFADVLRNTEWLTLVEPRSVPTVCPKVWNGYNARVYLADCCGISVERNGGICKGLDVDVNDVEVGFDGKSGFERKAEASPIVLGVR